MPLDPNAAALLAAMEEQGMPAFEDMSVFQARDAANAFRELQGEPADKASLVDRTVPGPAGRLPIRVYAPPGSPSGILIYIHGGGWVIGNIEVADGLCLRLTQHHRERRGLPAHRRIDALVRGALPGRQCRRQAGLRHPAAGR